MLGFRLGRIITGLQIFSSVLLKVKHGSAFCHLITARGHKTIHMLDVRTTYGHSQTSCRRDREASVNWSGEELQRTAMQVSARHLSPTTSTFLYNNSDPEGIILESRRTKRLYWKETACAFFSESGLRYLTGDPWYSINNITAFHHKSAMSETASSYVHVSSRNSLADTVDGKDSSSLTDNMLHVVDSSAEPTASSELRYGKHLPHSFLRSWCTSLLVQL